MKGRITFFGFTFFSLLLGLVFICLDSWTVMPLYHHHSVVPSIIPGPGTTMCPAT